ncbi:MAG TPA: sigma 54-interacting transcriptional regulator, partial [Rhodanobacteraceae bacterium]
VAANTKARRLLRHSPPHYAAGVGPAALNITHLFDCEITDILDISSTTDDQTRAFRAHHSDDVLFGTLIEPRQPPASSKRRELAAENVPVLDALAADDPTMRKTIACAKRLRDESINVMIVGETGVGKERLAQALHKASNRAGNPFIAVNCAAIPESLIESELFGYEPGAFTGARAKRMKGLIQQSDGGTLFLDEIGDMPVHLQTRLLRVLSEKEVLPLGAERPVPVDLRVVSATHRDVRQLLEDGSFREDLYYRLNGASLALPPLRDRADKQFVIRQVFNAVRGECRTARIRGDAMSALLAYSWPGNIRELHNALRFALATRADDQFITVDDLPDDCVHGIDCSAVDVKPAAPLGDSAGALYQLLRKHNWNITSVSKVLGVSRPTVYRRMREQQIVQPNLRG